MMFKNFQGYDILAALCMTSSSFAEVPAEKGIEGVKNIYEATCESVVQVVDQDGLGSKPTKTIRLLGTAAAEEYNAKVTERFFVREEGTPRSPSRYLEDAEIAGVGFGDFDNRYYVSARFVLSGVDTIWIPENQEHLYDLTVRYPNFLSSEEEIAPRRLEGRLVLSKKITQPGSVARYQSTIQPVNCKFTFAP